jgi:hypothetical protein
VAIWVISLTPDTASKMDSIAIVAEAYPPGQSTRSLYGGTLDSYFGEISDQVEGGCSEGMVKGPASATDPWILPLGANKCHLAATDRRNVSRPPE